MKRLALAFALVISAAALGGCGGSSSDRLRTGDASFSWRFRDYDGVTAGSFTSGDTGCFEAGITDVDVEIFQGQTRVFFATFPCADSGTGLPGAGVVDLAERAYDYRLTGYRLNDPVFEAVGSLTVSASAAASVSATLDVLTPAPLTLYYTQNGTFSCSGTPWVYYALYTDPGLGTLVDSRTISCDSNAFGFSLPQNLGVGQNFYLDFMQLLNGSSVSLWERCATTVRHTGFPVVLDLAAAPGGGC